jgi:hypothetical protein
VHSSPSRTGGNSVLGIERRIAERWRFLIAQKSLTACLKGQKIAFAPVDGVLGVEKPLYSHIGPDKIGQEIGQNLWHSIDLPFIYIQL